jgi:hypothetical protein
VWESLAAFNLMPRHEAWAKAREATQRALALDPDLPDAYVSLAGIAMWYEFDAAADVVKEGTRQGLTVFWADCILGIARARQGRADEARAILARMVEQHERLDVSHASISWVAASLGDFDTAFEWLERGYRNRDGLMAWVHVYTNLFVPALADDARFQSLLERMHLTDVAALLPRR